MAEVTLAAETGRETGSGNARRLRAEGKVPGVIYGLGKDTTEVMVEYRSLRKALTTDAGLNAIITLQVGSDREMSIVKELQRHPVRRDVLHVDFLRVDPDAAITVEVPIVLVGEAKNVEVGGYVDHVLYTLTIEAKPGQIPDELEIDISDLEIGESLLVSDLTLPSGTTTEVDPEEAIVFGQASRIAEEVEEADEEAAEALAEGEEGEAAEGDQADSDDADGDSDSDGGDDD